MSARAAVWQMQRCTASAPKLPQRPELAPGLERLQASYERLRFAPRGQERARALELARALGAADRQLAAATSRLQRRPVERLQSSESP